MLTRNDTASNVNRFGQSMCGLETVVLRRESKPAGNRKLSKILKKGGLLVNHPDISGLMKCLQVQFFATQELSEANHEHQKKILNQ